MTNPSTRIESTLGGWRTIDSAPKDGTLALIAEWPFMVSALYRDLYKGWTVPTQDRGWIAVDWMKPTHWLPLPPPPGEQPSMIVGWGMDIPPEFQR